MNHGLSLSFALIALALPNSPLAAQRGPTQGDFMRLRIDGQTNKARTKRVLNELVWHRTMASATSSARRKGRPIVVFQALGDIRGLC